MWVGGCLVLSNAMPGLNDCCSPCWREACTGRCRLRALEKFVTVCEFLHPLANCTKVAKDMVLAQVVQPCQEQQQGKRDQRMFVVAGVRVCRRAMQHILGIGGGRLHRLRKGHMDGRIGPRGPGDPRSGNHFAFSRIYDHLWRGIVYIVFTLCCSILPLRRVAL